MPSIFHAFASEMNSLRQSQKDAVSGSRSRSHIQGRGGIKKIRLHEDPSHFRCLHFRLRHFRKLHWRRLCLDGLFHRCWYRPGGRFWSSLLHAHIPITGIAGLSVIAHMIPSVLAMIGQLCSPRKNLHDAVGCAGTCSHIEAGGGEISSYRSRVSRRLGGLLRLHRCRRIRRGRYRCILRQHRQISAAGVAGLSVVGDEIPAVLDLAVGYGGVFRHGAYSRIGFIRTGPKVQRSGGLHLAGSADRSADLWCA